MFVNNVKGGGSMKKWYDEEYEFTVEVTGFLRGDHTEHYCRNGEEIGDKYTYLLAVAAVMFGVITPNITAATARR